MQLLNLDLNTQEFEMTDECKNAWTVVNRMLYQEFGAEISRCWFDQLFVAQKDEKKFLFAPTAFIKEWVSSYYIDKITKMLSEVGINIEGFCINSQENYVSSQANNSITSIFSHNLNSKYSFDSFIIGKSNEFAHAAARRVAEEDEVYNPLFLCGKVGMGKTHLMQAIGLYAHQYRNKRVLYCTAETFMYEFVNAIRHQTTMDFKKKFREVDLLLIDDIQFVADKGSTQEEMFHTWNSLMEQRKQVVVSADKFPSKLNGVTDRIKSRLGSGLVAMVHEADYELKLGFLQSKLQQSNVSIFENGVIEMLAESSVGSIRELEGMFITLSAQGFGKPVSVEVASNIINQRYMKHSRQIDIDEIKTTVADYYHIKLSDINAKIRTKNIALARQVAMFLCKNMTTMSLPNIGKKFGGRDHTTVMHAVKSITELMITDDEIKNDVNKIKAKLNQIILKS